MEAAGRSAGGALSAFIERGPRGGPRPLAGLLDRRRADRARGAALRFATLGLQSYHHDEIVTASRVLRGSFGHAMDAVGFSESAPPLYYALGLALDPGRPGPASSGCARSRRWPAFATVPVAYLLGAELRGRRAGIARRGAGRRQPDAALVLAGGAQLLAAGPVQRDRRRSTSSAPSSAAAARDLVRLGRGLGARPRDPLLRDLPDRARGLLLLRRRGARRRPASRSSLATGLLLAPLAIHQMSQGHADWIGDHSLGHRLWEIGGHLRGRRDRRRDRPAGAPHAGDRAAGGDRRRARCCWPSAAERGERRAGGADAGDRRLHGRRCRWRSPWSGPQADFVLARNLIPALVPLLVAVAIGVTARAAPAAPGSPSPRCCSPTRSGSPSSPALAVAAAARLGRGRRSTSASRGRRGRWSPGRSGRRRSATTSRPAPSRSPRRKDTPGSCTKSTSSPTAPRRLCRRPARAGLQRRSPTKRRRAPDPALLAPGPCRPAAAAESRRRLPQLRLDHRPPGRHWPS